MTRYSLPWAALAMLAATENAGRQAASAQLLSVDVSNDVAWISGAETLDDEALRRVTLPSTASALALGTLPAAADVTAYDLLADSRRAFALDTFADLGGGVLAGPEDLVAWNGTSYAIWFDGSAAGVPAGAAIDAAAFQHQAGLNYVLLSFDVPVALPGGVFADDEDIVAWNGMAWSVFLDGSGLGIPEGMDVDGFDRDTVTGTRYFSFDVSGKISTVDFDDEDVVAFNGMTWSLAFDASAGLDPTFSAGDLDALGIRTNNIFTDGFFSGTTGEWSSVQQ